MKTAHKSLSLILVCLASLLLFQAWAQKEKAPAHAWSYTGEEGPEHWGDLRPEYAACKNGRQQSPIDIRDARESVLAPIQFDYKPSKLRLIDNGHTIQVIYEPGSSITVGNRRYELQQFHFHHPSEEEIDGKHYDMVAHLVHSDRDGKLAVVAVLLTQGAGNPLMQLLWNHLPREKEREIEVEGVKPNAADLLPANRRYFTFPGSLTTPPCTEGVTWFVLQTPTEISSAEIAKFAELYPMNARPVQSLNGRTVMRSK